jgi:pimeloyl-ACP methyl ester carboxylesterase
MSFAYADVFYGGDNGAGHAFVYVPPHQKEEKLGALIFAHGAAGNFASYIHVWRALADAERLVIVCPTFGWGNWQAGEGLEVLREAVAHARAAHPVDRQRIFLAGLSQGGTGVTRAAPELAGEVRGAILISAVPVLMLHGGEDERVPRAYTERGAGDLEKAGAKVSLRIFEGEDHFLFFSQRAWSLEEIGSFIREQR